MRRLSRTNNLRLGIILAVTGIIALAHALLSTSHHLGTRPTFIIGIVLVVLGLPFLLAALRRRKDGLEHRITAHELTQQRQAERDERHQQRLASGEDDPGRRTSNPRPPRRVTLGRPPNA